LISAPGTPSADKNRITAPLLFFDARVERSGHVETATTTQQLTVQGRNCFTMALRAHVCSCAPNEQCKQRKKLKKFIANTF
jgi:hypothetical protein